MAFTYQNGANGQQLYTPANPGPGGVTIFPINTTPYARHTLHGERRAQSRRRRGQPRDHFVYVVEQDATTTANLLGFSENRPPARLRRSRE